MADTQNPNMPGRGKGTDAPIMIVGAGLAGLYTALKLAPMPVTVISTAPLGLGASSAWAQGGIAAAVGEGDTPEQHAADTIKTGAGIVDAHMANLIAAEAPERIEDLLRYGVPFDKDLEGRLKLSREAAHGRRRIVRVKGDLAGKAIMSALITAARNTPSITFMEGYTVKDLAHSNGRVNGLYLWPAGEKESGEGVFHAARGVVIAAGGIGGLFAVTTNPVTNRGDGLAMAARAGAVIADAEFVQFHPTAINVGRDPAPLASEALRGEGAILVNGLGERFMTKLHPDAELGPRDVVARAVHEEVVSGRGAYLDCRTAIGERIRETFPTVSEQCLAAGIDPAKDLIPVAPAAHYHMGGIWTDDYGRSSVPGLWACGEVTSTGAHGANRLASNSLLEAMVFAGRIAEDIAASEQMRDAAPNLAISKPAGVLTGANDMLVAELRAMMSKRLGVVRDGAGLREALETLDGLQARAGRDITVLNMVSAARFISYAALKREESRGAHYRSDFPEPRERFAHRSKFTLSDLPAAEPAGRSVLSGSEAHGLSVSPL